MAVALTAALLAPGAAAAATAYMDGGVLRVAGTDQRDVLEVRYIGSGGLAIGVSELFKNVTPGPGCSDNGSGAAVCPYNGTSSVSVDLGAGDDELYSDAGVPVTATGDAGDDRMYVRSGLSPWETAPVHFDGGDGDDIIGGGSGDDVILGGPGDDGIDGADGNDHVDPGPGQDSVTDSSGNDTIEARDGAVDHVDCGPGTDTGDFDPFDVVNGCELGNLPPASPPDCTPQVDKVSAISYSTLRRRHALRVSVAADPACTLRARISVGSGVVVAAATTSAHQALLKIRLTDRALRHIRRRPSFTVTITSSAPRATTVRRSFKVRVRH